MIYLDNYRSLMSVLHTADVKIIGPRTYQTINGNIYKIRRHMKMTVVKTKSELLEAMERAQLSSWKVPFSIVVSMPDLPEYEVITNPIENLALKASYYDRAYTDRLELKANTGIRIVGYKYHEDKLSFGEAINILKSGGKVAREGWNGKDMYLEMQVPTELSKMTLPYLYLKTADNNLVPWTASQTDVLAMDWEIVQ